MTKKRIAGMHVCKNGNIAMVWLSVKTESGHIHVYDCCQFKIDSPEDILHEF